MRHGQQHADTPESLWQLAGNFRASCTAHPTDGSVPIQVKIRAPRGMYTDLASVPDILWGIVGPIGAHLEASILHDYLYMAWTDFGRSGALKRDWDFADLLFLAGMEASGVPADRRLAIYAVVHTILTGWPVFRRKPHTLQNRMEKWLPHLAAGHGR